MSKVVSIVSLARDKLMLSESGPCISEKRVSQWEELMRKFSESHKEQCKSVPLDIPRVPRSVKIFPTGSQYEGSWDVLGMSGYGAYIFPNGVLYEGEFEDGMFDGLGELRYESGAVLRGKWKQGVMVERTLVFNDGLEYSESDWKYCKLPDRRFTIEYDNGVQTAGESFLTADQPTRDIPPGYYDTGDGFYDPKTKVIYKSDDLTAIMRSPSAQEQKWIVSNCHVNPMGPLGPRQDLYEEWSKPDEDPDVPPPPAASSKVGGTRFRSQSMYETDLDVMHDFELFYDNFKKRQSSMTSGRMTPRFMSTSSKTLGSMASTPTARRPLKFS